MTRGHQYNLDPNEKSAEMYADQTDKLTCRSRFAIPLAILPSGSARMPVCKRTRILSRAETSLLRLLLVPRF